MPNLALTDLTIRSLKADRQTDFWDTKAPGFGVRVGPRSKTFIVKVGNSRRTIGAYPSLSLQDARRAAQIEKMAPSPSSISPTFQEAYRLFQAHHVSVKKRNTRLNYEGFVERNFLKPFGEKRLDDIGNRQIVAITDKLTPSNRAYALAVIRIFWNFCRRRHLTKNNPVDTVQLVLSPPRDRVLSDHELRCIWQACEPSTVLRRTDSSSLSPFSNELAERCAQPVSPTFAAIVKLLILTGQRRGEIAGLQTSWISNSGTASPTRSQHSSRDSSGSPGGGCSPSDAWQIRLPKEITKNGREHTFPIGSLAASIISAAADGSCESLFPARGQETKPFNGFSKAKAALDKKLGPDFKPWTLHDLRRTFATNLAALGVRMEVTERLLNHISGPSQGGIVGVYQKHHFKEEKRHAIELWQARLKEIVDAA